MKIEILSLQGELIQPRKRNYCRKSHLGAWELPKDGGPATGEDVGCRKDVCISKCMADESVNAGVNSGFHGRMHEWQSEWG